MDKNKYDFIQELLENKKLTAAQKERVFLLTKEEIKKDAVNGQVLEERVKKIEVLITSKKNGKKNIEKFVSEPSKSSLSGYIDPFAKDGVSKFLKAYNENPILNSTCHEIDDEDSLIRLLEHCVMTEYNFNNHLNSIKKEFAILANNYKINTKLYSLIRAYIHGGVKWSTDKIEMSWSNLELTNWSIANPNYVPNPGINFVEKNEKEGYHLTKPFISSLTGKNITAFSDVVLLFKSMFHINSNNSLKKNILRINNIKKFNDWSDIEINELNFSENIHLYTDVDKLIQAYVKLIELIKSINTENKVNNRPRILVSFYELENNILFTIHHINSTFRKSLMSTISHPFGLSMSPIIENQINGLCNLDLKADFGNNDFARINLWNGAVIEKQERFEQFKGVEYILKFER